MKWRLILFISTYNTYIQTDTSNRTQKQKTQKGSEDSKFSIDPKLLNNAQTNKTNYLNLPIDYTANSKTFNNKHKIELQEKQQQNKELTKSTDLIKKFTNYETLQNAKNTYEYNSKLFQFLKKPSLPLNQTPKIDKELPKSIQELKEQNLRNTMVNTYIQNDKYYQITA